MGEVTLNTASGAELRESDNNKDGAISATFSGAKVFYDLKTGARRCKAQDEMQLSQLNSKPKLEER